MKDLLLLLLIGFIFKHRNNIQPMFKKEIINAFLVFDAALLAFVFQWYTLKYLPVVDCFCAILLAVTTTSSSVVVSGMK